MYRKHKYEIWAIGFFILVGLAIWMAASNTREAKAIREAEAAVMESLKTPSTAEFCEKTKIADNTSEKWFEVEGCIDAENGYGAKIRSDWTVELYYDEDAKKWEVDDVSIWNDESDVMDQIDQLYEYWSDEE